MRILVPNLGSTSLKYQILSLPALEALASGRRERVVDFRSAIESLRPEWGEVDAVAFKTVHGGAAYRGTYFIDSGVLAALERFLPAAPVHNRIYIDAIQAFQYAMPGTPLIAAFETEFHKTIPEPARVYGVPEKWRLVHEVERYGFHGASHQFISERLPEFLGRAATGLRGISCHLGGSSSICAIRDGRSVEITMGFSPQSGLENATRHGDLDVFAVLTVMDREGWSTQEVRRQLAGVGGLAGLSGIAGGDVRDIAQAASEGSQPAALALEVFAHQVKKTIGAYAAILGGLDAVAFTGGIGENSGALREACCRGLEFLGIRIDEERNHQTGDRFISPADAPVALVALATNEERIVARRAYQLLATSARANSLR